MIYVILNGLVNSNDMFLDIRESIWWPLIYFLFYIIAFNDNKGIYLKTLIKKIFPILFIIFFIQYLFIREGNFIFYTQSGVKIYESSNQIFFNSLLLPFAFLLNDKRVKYIILIIGLIIVLYSFKRSAIIYTTLIVIMSIYYDFIHNKESNPIRGIVLSCIIISVGLYSFRYIDKQTSGNISQRFETMEMDKGSGRLDVYKNVWKLYQGKSLELKILGSGNNSVADDNVIFSYGQIKRLSAHNDFLEILYDFGIIGIVLYFIIIINILKRIFYLNKIDDKLFQANLAVFIIFIVVSLFSHLVIYPSYFAYLAIIWAITEGLIMKEKILNSQ